MEPVDQSLLRPTKVSVVGFVITQILSPVLLCRDDFHVEARFPCIPMYRSAQRIPRSCIVVKEAELSLPHIVRQLAL